jgi:hypothetical protein
VLAYIGAGVVKAGVLRSRNDSTALLRSMCTRVVWQILTELVWRETKNTFLSNFDTMLVLRRPLHHTLQGLNLEYIIKDGITISYLL